MTAVLEGISKVKLIDKDNSLKEELEGQEKDASSILEFRYIYGIDEVER